MQVTIKTNARNIQAQKLRALISLALACSKERDDGQLDSVMEQIDAAVAGFKLACCK